MSLGNLLVYLLRLALAFCNYKYLSQISSGNQLFFLFRINSGNLLLYFLQISSSIRLLYLTQISSRNLAIPDLIWHFRQYVSVCITDNSANLFVAD